MSSETASEYFDFIAKVGLPEHPGSIEATRELIQLCRIESGKTVLDVGCGVGVTPAYLAKSTGCRVTGVDLLESMVEQARRRAGAAGVGDRVEFRAADARDLPFDDNLFDAVISESVIVFFDDKRQAMSEYVRVTKPGGYVGAAEMTWLKPPSPELEERYRRMACAHPLEDSGWRGLLEEAGLTDVVGDARRNDQYQESKGLVERYGCRGTVIGALKTLVLSLTDRRAREFVKMGAATVSRDMLDILGYGVYAGRKP